jgi:predicted alpha/beta hydrolase
MFMVTCRDGWRLHAEVLAPESARAVAVVGHAMFVNRKTLDRRGRGLVSHLASRGIAVIWFDLRGHGQSGPSAAQGGQWGYDDLVEGDVPAMIAFARERFPSLPLTVVGHSLFSHVTLAHLTRHSTPIEKLVLLAGNYVHSEWRLRSYADKGSMIIAMNAISRALGYFPVRRMKLGSDDEAAPFVFDFWRNLKRREWHSRDGFSYDAARSKVKIPIFSIAGAGDRMLAPPEDAYTLVAPCPNSRFDVAGRRSGLPFDPGHMELVLDPRCRPVWDQTADFILSRP